MEVHIEGRHSDHRRQRVSFREPFFAGLLLIWQICFPQGSGRVRMVGVPSNLSAADLPTSYTTACFFYIHNNLYSLLFSFSPPLILLISRIVHEERKPKLAILIFLMIGWDTMIQSHTWAFYGSLMLHALGAYVGWFASTLFFCTRAGIYQSEWNWVVWYSLPVV